MIKAVQGNAKFLMIASLIALIFFLQFGFVQAATIPNFPFDEINANFQNISPADNASYIGDVPVNISVRLTAHSRFKNSFLIPYQEISCLFRVDEGEWQNASLYKASEQTYFGDPMYGGFSNDIYCSYNATLQGLSTGAHFLDIDFKPDLSDHIRISSNGKLFASDHSRPTTTLPKNASITFYVIASNEPTATFTPSVPLDSGLNQAFLSAIAGVIVIVVVALVLLFYLKKRKANAEIVK